MDDLLKALQLHDYYAVAALLLTIAIQVLRKAPYLSDRIWQRIPEGARFLVPLIGGATIAFIGAFDEGKALWPALQAALGGAFAIGGGASGVAAWLRESPIPWDGRAGGRPKPPSAGSGGVPIGLVLAFALALLPGCSPASWQQQREISNAIAAAGSEVVLPAIEREHTAALERAVASSETLIESRQRGAVVTEQWRPIFEAFETFRLAHAAWQVAIESEGDTLATAAAMRDAFCKLRVVAKDRVKLPDFPIPGAECR